MEESEIEEVKKYSDDRDKFFDYVKKDGLVLEWASDELKNDKELVLEAVKCDRRSIRICK
ncbi:MAG: DUF4116 domain-containing protein [Clostridia bacterium]|nr:DUF4116 domain-containing protein [Clostridia bacterium]